MNKWARLAVVLIMPLLVICLIALFHLINIKVGSKVLVVVPHHDVVKEKRLDLWKSVEAEIELVIVIGPDHFGGRQDRISYSQTNFVTYLGEFDGMRYVKPDYFGGEYVRDDRLVARDHAVTSLLSELKEKWGDAKIAPFLIGNKVKMVYLDGLRSFIDEKCADKSCLVVASVDFSHFLEKEEADSRDEETAQQLSKRTITDGSLKVPEHADCPQCLYVLQETARGEGLKWVEVFRNNHGVGTDRTTHFIGRYE